MEITFISDSFESCLFSLDIHLNPSATKVEQDDTGMMVLPQQLHEKNSPTVGLPFNSGVRCSKTNGGGNR